jgi:hypothetical protein
MARGVGRSSRSALTCCWREGNQRRPDTLTHELGQYLVRCPTKDFKAHDAVRGSAGLPHLIDAGTTYVHSN